MDAVTPLIDTYRWLDLSAAQRGVWLDMQLIADPGSYQLGGWTRMDAALDVDAARQAASLVMARNDALRLRIDPYQPRQRIEAAGAPVCVTDLSGEPDAHAAFRAFADQAFRRGLPLGDASLIQIDLVQAGARCWYMLWRVHHLISDSISVGITLQRWAEAYDALVGEGSAELSPPSSFVAGLEADRAYEDSAQFAVDLAYWQARFAHPVEPLFSPGPPGPAVTPVQWTLVGAAYHAFAAACQRSGVTRQRCVLALVALMLARTYGRRDLALGVALHRRGFATRDMVGMLAGLMPVRCDVDPDSTVDEALLAVAEALDRDFRHQRVAMDALGRALAGSQGERPLLFEVVVSHLVEEAAPTPLAVAGRPVSSEVWRGPETAPLALYAVERPYAASITFELTGNPAFVDEDLCRRLATALERMTACFVDDPWALLDEVDLLGEEERALVLTGWNPAPTPFPSGSLAALFAAQAARTPEADAVVEDGRTLSYAALDAASDALAAALQDHGIVPQAVVGVALPRSADTIVCLLAILKAGAVYLPLDPAYPPERLAFMLQDAGAALVLADAERGLALPHLRPDAAMPGSRPQPVAVQPGHLAYIIYTSGSTGTPKGVAVSHEAAANVAFARSHGHDPIGVGDRVLAAISVGFDVSIGQLLLPLLSGACVVVAPDLRTLSADAFWALLAERRVSHVNSVPSFFDSVLDAAPPEPGLKRLMLGGEALSGALSHRLRSALPGIELVNMYGPTEACIDATAYPVPPDAREGLLPIGRPLANYRAYVLDARLRPVPSGVAGELFLGGPGLARGYVGQPGLTASRFVADPFGAPGGRLYRTGDRASWRADGTLAFLGREDGQVKIRGFRVELGEIEAALQTHPAVAQAAVAAHADGTRLVAYIVGTAEPDHLRVHLAQRLPPYMVPALFVALDALPLTRNGKLDRKALPAPAAADDASRILPATPLEVQVAAMFARLLGVPDVAASDDFFALGGHSLLATRLVSQVRAECGVDLPLRSVFAAPTVAALALAIAAHGEAPVLPQLTAGARPDAIPLSFAQQRLWVLDQIGTGAGTYVIPVTLRLTGRLDVDALDAALRQVVARHESLRTRFAIRDGAAVQVVEPAAGCLWLQREARDVAPDRQDDAIRDHAAAAAREPFDLAAGGLFRARLLSLSPQTHVLSLAMHHIVSDGWSMGVLMTELTTLYGAFAQGLPDPLPPLPIQYADYALWQRRSLTEERLDALLSHWRGALAGAPLCLDLPQDRPRPATPSARGAMSPWHCPPALVTRLRSHAREADATLFMLLLTAFQALLSRWSGAQDLLVGTPIAQRTLAETEPLIGFFVNTLALRADLSGRPRFRDALDRGRETILAAYTHQDMPFEALVQAMEPERDLGRHPVVQVMFALQNAPLPPVELPGLRMEPVESPSSVAKFDLTLTVTETAAGGLAGGFEYAVDLFDTDTIDRLGAWFSRLLAGIAEDPFVRLDEVDLLGEEERALVLTGWNPAPTPFPSGSLAALFAAQAARTPEADAVVEDGRTLSYAALDAASDALAAALQDHGIVPQAVVGVALPRSADTIVCLLAILKAGAVYLPLDPAYPPERLAFMLQDAGAALVLADAERGLALPHLRPDAAMPGSRPQPVAVQPGHLAYIIYTSGSTGTPKGVAVSHEAAANVAFARSHGHDPIGVGDRVLAAISVGFDVSIGQLLLPLLSGACVVVAPDLRTLSADAFWALLAERRVSHVNSVPSFFDSVLDAAPPEPGLKRLMLGGEALSGALSHRLRSALPGIELVNMYGPTEACIDATAYPVPPDAREGLLPIGRPLANYRAYVLDARLRPVPSGVAGELFLGGPGLARGYVGQPGLTASRFVADPFGAPGGRLYRTGDRASWRADGTLAFLGREDGQVKIRGFRVELGEIEAALQTHPAVAQAAVADHADGTRLVAYIVGTAEPDHLRAHLAQRLPPYMVPALFVALDALPLTRNGKLDRKALPAPPLAQRGCATHVPRDVIEQRLQAIWQDVLDLPDIALQDDFFDIGGTSLSGIRLITACNAAFGADVPVAALFLHRTIEAMAAALRENAGFAYRALVPLRAGRAGTPPIVCVHPHGGTVFCYNPLLQHLPPGHPVVGLQAAGLEPGAVLPDSIEEMAAAYVAALREAYPTGPYMLVGYSMGGSIAFEMARRLLAEDPRSITGLTLLDSWRPDGALPPQQTEADMLAALGDDLGLPPTAPPPQSVADLFQAATAARALPPDFTLAQAERLVALWNNNVRLMHAYRPAPRLDIPLLQARALQRDIPLSDWTPLVAASVRTIDLDCTHRGLMTADHAACLADAIVTQIPTKDGNHE